GAGSVLTWCSLGKWGGRKGINSSPHEGNVVAPEQAFTRGEKALSKYFGPAANTGLIMSYVGYQLFNDQIVLKPCASLFNYVMLMSYGAKVHAMVEQFKQYAAIVGAQNLMFGIGGDPWQTPLSRTEKLAAWEPANGTKGGMMEYNIDNDTNYQAADAIIKALSSPQVAATAR